VVAGALALLLVPPAIWLYVWTRPAPALPVRAEVVNLGTDFLEPGTDVGDGPPEGYSDLVIKVSQRVSPKFESRLSEEERRLFGQFFSVLAAKVDRSDTGEHVLSRVAFGTGTRIGSRERIVSADSAERLGAALGWRAKILLTRIEAYNKDIRVRNASNSFATADVQVVHKVDSVHQFTTYRYGILLDPASGKLTSYLWGVKRNLQSTQGELFTPIVELPGSYHRIAELVVDPSQIILGVPKDTAFACEQFAEGKRRLTPSPQLRTSAAHLDPDRATMLEMEDHLRKLVTQSGS
jgi:hypothetical protein